MDLATIILAAAVASGDLSSKAVETSGVHVNVKVVGSKYRWEVTNLSVEPIRDITIPQHRLYAATPPDDWSMELSDDIVHAWTDEPSAAIGRGSMRAFEATVSLEAAILGSVTMTLTTTDGTIIPVDGVWGPVKYPTVATVLVPILVLGIGLLHAGVCLCRTMAT